MNETKPTVTLQLYTLRDHVAKDLAGTLGKVAEMGYQGVELAGYGDLGNAEKVKRALETSGLQLVSNHVGSQDLQNDLQRVIDEALILGNKYVTCSGLFSGERSEDGYREFAKLANQAGARLNSSALQLCYHNHDFELNEKVDGMAALDYLYSNTEPTLLQAELDTYWVEKGGENPADYIRKYAGRVPLLHIKDMAKDEAKTFAEVGEGSLDWNAIFAAAEEVGGTVSYIVEQDTCPGEPLDSARKSLENLKAMGKL